jgi:hypothetical protein
MSLTVLSALYVNKTAMQNVWHHHFLMSGGGGVFKIDYL